MARPKPLTSDEIRERLIAVPDWECDGKALRCQYRFATFADAFAWMAGAALEAEKLDHHPDWRNIYNRVDVELSTHDVKGLTDLDFALARRMDEFAKRFQPAPKSEH